MATTGESDKRLSVQQATEADDAHGNPRPTWSEIARRWARVQDLTGREFFQARQVSADVTTRIVLREIYEDLTTRMRFQYLDRFGDTHTYEILSITGVTDRDPSRGQEVLCKRAG